MNFKNNKIKFILSKLILLVFAYSVTAESSDSGRYPDDPFKYDNQLIKASEIGSAPGQIQFAVLGATISGNNSKEDYYFGGKLSTEYILNESNGLRFTAFQDTFDTDGGSLQRKFTSLRSGPTFHFLPYKQIDMGSYMEAGFVVVDLIDGKSGDKAPEVAVGGFIIYHIDSAFFIRAEMERSWTQIEINGVTGKYHRTAALLGLGISF